MRTATLAFMQLLRRPCAYDARRHADGDGIGRQVASDHRPGSDNATIANGDTGGNYDTNPQPHVIADGDVLFGLRLLAKWRAGSKLIVGGGDKNFGSQRHKITDDDPAFGWAGPKIAPFADVTILADRDQVSVTQGSVWRHAGTGANLHPGSLLHMAVSIEMDQTKNMKIGAKINHGQYGAAEPDQATGSLLGGIGTLAHQKSGFIRVIITSINNATSSPKSLNYEGAAGAEFTARPRRRGEIKNFIALKDSCGHASQP